MDPPKSTFRGSRGLKFWHNQEIGFLGIEDSLSQHPASHLSGSAGFLIPRGKFNRHLLWLYKLSYLGFELTLKESTLFFIHLSYWLCHVAYWFLQSKLSLIGSQLKVGILKLLKIHLKWQCMFKWKSFQNGSNRNMKLYNVYILISTILNKKWGVLSYGDLVLWGI